MTGLRIGYYVHHHGRGHATRAGVVGAALVARGHEVTYLGSGVLPDGGARVRLSRDDVLTVAEPTFRDPAAGGSLHWAPQGGGYTERMHEIAAWLAETRPDVVVVDVSVEVTALVRLLGTPVVVVAQPGVRDDTPHDLAHGLASAILAPWPEGLDLAPHLVHRRDTTTFVGGVSRFAESAGVARRSARPRPCPPTGPGARTRGVLLVGGEGWDDPSTVDALVAAVPEVEWRSPSPRVGVDELLADADLVVTHAGQNAVADVAAFGVPAVVLAQGRPFDEQAAMARALTSAGLARGLAPGATSREIIAAVRELLADTHAVDAADHHPTAWHCWCTAGAAQRACEVVENVARRTA